MPPVVPAPLVPALVVPALVAVLVPVAPTAPVVGVVTDATAVASVAAGALGATPERYQDTVATSSPVCTSSRFAASRSASHAARSSEPMSTALAKG